MGPNIVTGKRSLRSARGFTLIELMIVMSIIVTLATVGLVQYRQSVLFAREAVLRSDLRDMREAIDQYYADKNQDPQGLEDLVTYGYMRAIPVDPFTNSAETWQTVPSEPDPANPTATLGIRDVKSGSELAAIDGSNYADW
jgi:general secretion pathway protein G